MLQAILGYKDQPGNEVKTVQHKKYNSRGFRMQMPPLTTSSTLMLCMTVFPKSKSY